MSVPSASSSSQQSFSTEEIQKGGKIDNYNTNCLVISSIIAFAAMPVAFFVSMPSSSLLIHLAPLVMGGMGLVMYGGACFREQKRKCIFKALKIEDFEKFKFNSRDAVEIMIAPLKSFGEDFKETFSRSISFAAKVIGK